MELKNFTYLLLMLGTALVPLILSFEKEVAYASRWKYLFPSIAATGLFFIAWDVWFTSIGIWSFNPEYLIGVKIINLPLEEWLFFIAVPFSCVFIYDVLKVKLSKLKQSNLFTFFTYLLILISGLLFALHTTKLYTSINFFLLFLFLIFTHFLGWFRKFYPHFYLAWLIGLIPFVAVNGILTGLPVVEYNPLHNMGIRLITIPVEDSGYFLLLFLMVMSGYEYLTEKKYY